MPRPTKLTPKIQERIFGYLRTGAHVESAAAAAGIVRQTLYNWLKWGAEGKEPYAAFCEAIEEAQALADVRDHAFISKAAETQWQAAAWRQERRHPELWGRNRERKDSDEREVRVIVNVSTSPHEARPPLDADTEAE